MTSTDRPRRAYVIDSAPGKDLFARISANADADALYELFNLRAIWCGGYPLIHDRFVTYGAFSDLTRTIDPEALNRLVPAGASLAESCPDQLFHLALFLLGDLIPDDRIGERPQGFSDSLLRIRMRAEKLSFLPNLVCAWNSLAGRSRYLKTKVGDPLHGLSPRNLGIDEQSWKRFVRLPLQAIKDSIFDTCEVSFADLRDCFKKWTSTQGNRELIFSTKIEETRYWVWKVNHDNGTAHIATIVFLRQPSNGALGLGSWEIYEQFSERWSVDNISRRLLEIEFYPHDNLFTVARRVSLNVSSPLIGEGVEVVFIAFDMTKQNDQRAAGKVQLVMLDYPGATFTLIDGGNPTPDESMRIPKLGCLGLPALVLLKNGEICQRVDSYGRESAIRASMELVVKK